jgi:acyl carrier protein
MEANEILLRVSTIFRMVLEDEAISLTYATTANDVEEWDSLNHIQLVVAIEKEFKIKFTTLEIQRWKNVGELCQSIASRIG